MRAEWADLIMQAVEGKIADVKLSYYGHISSYDKKTNCVKAVIPTHADEEDNYVETDWIPLATLQSGDEFGLQIAPKGGASEDDPTKGEQVKIDVIHRETGVFLTGHLCYNDKMKPPGKGSENEEESSDHKDSKGDEGLKGGEVVWKHESGSFWKFFENGDVVIYAEGEMIIRSKKGMTLKSEDETIDITAKKAISMTSEDEGITETAKKSHTVSADEHINQTAKLTYNANALTTMNMSAGVSFTAKGLAKATLKGGITSIRGGLILENGPTVAAGPAAGQTNQVVNASFGQMVAAVATYQTSMPTLSTALGVVQSVAGTFGSITSVAQGLAAISSITGALGSIGSLIPGISGALGSIQGVVSNIGGISSTLSSLGGMTSFSGISGALGRLSSLGGNLLSSYGGGLFSLATAQMKLSTISDLMDSASTAAGSVGSGSTLSQVQNAMQDIYNIFTGSTYSTTWTDFTGAETSWFPDVDDITDDLGDVDAVLSP